MQTELFITTPCLNAVRTIDQTIQSVVSQAGPVRIRYHVQDGGSSDGTWERVLWWQAMLARGDWPLACADLQFSCHQAPDGGLYDAIVSGFAALQPGGNGFLAWINADDIYLPGSFAFIAAADRQFPAEVMAWIGGSVSVIRDDMVVASHDRELPTAVIRAGLCDHAHWHFVQQEGSFFRGWLWNRVRPEETIRQMKLAGDWNLWRLMAGHAELVQAGRPLASFRVSPDQLSATQAEAYRAEINAILPEAQRRQALKEIAGGAPPTRLRLESRFAANALTLVEEAVDGRHYTRYPETFDAVDFKPMRRIRMKGKADRPMPAPAARDRTAELSASATDRLRHVRREGWLQALDDGWQYPAITEEHALRRLEAMGGLPDGLIYVAYPWATLIDHLQAKGVDAEAQEEVFEAFCAGLPEGGVRVTVCQHMLLPRFLDLFRKAGIDHVFWPHATEADLGADAPYLHPFPLYPVQMPDKAPAGPEEDRPHLYSFIGARANPHYLTEVRSWILDQLGGRAEGLVRGREDWHYAKVVYHHQIWQVTEGESGPLVDDLASREFKEALSQSVFALCPSGSGPNSIRLWEALGAGAIPVILSDHLALPGDPRLWSEGAIFCAETPDAVADLPDRLASIAGDAARLAKLRAAGRQIWDLYGSEGFVTDILELGTRVSQAIEEQGSSVSVRRLARRILASPRPDPTEAELLLTLADRAGADAVTATQDSFAANISVTTALARAAARLGSGHPVLRDLTLKSGSRGGEYSLPRTDETESVPADQGLFPGALAAAARRARIHNGTNVPERDMAHLHARRAAALAASDLPETALLSDHDAALYRLYLTRDPEMEIADCLARWRTCPAEEDRMAEQDAHWPDPGLARFSRLYGRTGILWSIVPSVRTAVEALVLGAVPACPDLPGLDRVVPDNARLDLTGLDPQKARRTVAAFEPDARFAADWLAARAVLRLRLSDPARLEAARYAVISKMFAPD
jgi:hypothetical protein